MSDRPADNTSTSTPLAGMVAAVVLLLASGAGYRSLAGWYSRAPGSVAIPAGTLAGLPLKIGEWTGYDDPVDEYVIRQTDTDDHLNRVYERRQGRHSVSLWIAYGVHLRDLMPHRPEVCYSGAGWTLETNRLVEWTGVDGTVVPCRIMRFMRGALATERLTVLNYYIVDGQYSADVSRLRLRAARGSDAASYAAQVQIVSGTTGQHERGAELVRAFATESAPAIASLLFDAVEAVASATSETS